MVVNNYMNNPEAFLKAYLTNLMEHGHGAISMVTLMDKIEDAFHKNEVEKDLDANGKKLYYDLVKEI